MKLSGARMHEGCGMHAGKEDIVKHRLGGGSELQVVKGEVSVSGKRIKAGVR